MKSITTRISAILLCFIISIGMMPYQAFADSAKNINDNCITFTGEEAFTISLVKEGSAPSVNIEYSLDKENWEGYTIGSEISAAGKVIYFRGSGNKRLSTDSSKYHHFVTDKKVSASGNIMTLLDYTDPQTEMTDENEFCFHKLFIDNTNLLHAPELSATTLATCCYESMFSGCTALLETPELPATEIAPQCYGHMFDNCSSIKKVSELPATEIAPYCYISMFRGCSSLTKAPALPADTLKDHCYSEMFRGCSALTDVPRLAASTIANSCYKKMFQNCSRLNVVEATDKSEATWIFPDSEPSDCYTSFIYGTGGELQTVAKNKMYRVFVHKHSFTFKVKENSPDTLIALCEGEGKCTLGSEEISLRITANSKGYDGTAATATLVKNGADDIDKDLIPDIVYKNVLTGIESTEAPSDAGCYKASLTIGTATASTEFTISPAAVSDANLSVKGIADKEYNSSVQTQDITILLDGTEIDPEDYDISYENNIEAGTASMTIKFKGNYSGTVEKSFKITRKAIKASDVKLSKAAYAYNGKAKTPAVSIKGLKKGKDYTVSYSNNINAGTAKVTIKGTENYKGVVVKSFTIKKASQPVAVKTKSKSVKKSVINKRSDLITGAVKVTGAKGKVSYTKLKTNNYAYKICTVNKSTGAITVKKHTCVKTTRTHTIKVRVNVAATKNYKAYSKTVKVVIKMTGK